MSEQELLKLDEERMRMEKRAKELTEYLTAPGMPGLKGGLDTPDGYPRNDIDVHGILIARNELACLNTDYNELMKKVEQKLAELHAATA
ncbi:putative 26S proteasome non-ATPase regulatory subunit 9 [Gregarina niphandrodes]|uniref:26S proteasome non-ATPase regulatory subunit 9 n=1 Tax=Gregarina niphandrodes TaxID=110365 RepID=A0A023AYK7_GRENI|nr:putative 26S proteasome non-ATPase regulatory subunit 9 [Gregarina niphandrodes]EZG43518.1 putative 26S proteasome non-ATPase regulatory subunit 9 [Gregarina niphandrodes]|eukprot:XP_011133251.1 putative 26S proteasome non-ATPase regulatory subunit 9 [Gregarina niphandrodes]